MRWNVATAQALALLFVAAAIGGCLAEEGDGGAAATDGTDDTGPTPGGGGNTTGNQTQPDAPSASVAVFVDGNESTEENGSFVASVGSNLTFDGSNSTGMNVTFEWDLGDGNTTDGPVANHSYSTEGNYTVTLNVSDEFGRSDSASVNVTVTAAAGASDLQTFWEHDGLLLGCEPSATNSCLSMEMGPDEDPIDGIWIPLGEPYWGYSVTGEVDNQRGDSDCFWLDEEHGVIGDGHNGAEACAGEIPEGAAWLFVFSYAEPATYISVTVLLE